MEAYSNHSCHEGIMLFSVYHEPVQPIIIEDTVIDTFRCGTLLIYFFVSFRTSWDICVQPDVPFRPGFDDAAIFGRGAAAFAFCFVVFSIRTAPHLASNMAFGTVIIPVWNHGKPGIADGSAVFINADVIMDCFRMPAFAVEVDQRTYVPILEETVCGKIVHGGIKTHILYRKSRHVFFQLMKSSKEGDGIMAFCAGKTEQQWNVCMQRRIIAGQLKQSIPKVKGIEVAIPSPGGIRVRIMSFERSIFLLCKRMFRAWQDMAVRVGMGMDSCAIAGDGKLVAWDKAAFEGWKYGDNIKKLLEACFKVERDIFSMKDSGNDGIRDGGTALGSFLVLARWSIRLFMVPVRRKELIPLIKGMSGVSPKSIHEVIVRTQRGK